MVKRNLLKWLIDVLRLVVGLSVAKLLSVVCLISLLQHCQTESFFKKAVITGKLLFYVTINSSDLFVIQ